MSIDYPAEGFALRVWLCGPLGGLFGGMRLLPFHYPIDGAGAGFDPIDHTALFHSMNEPAI
ncbi:MAG TPA: hypothetical protein VFY29_09805 [Terriglobia bacterium]|nr:hypothetical protein [Terriglobia bacterium]